MSNSIYGQYVEDSAGALWFAVVRDKGGNNARVYYYSDIRCEASTLGTPAQGLLTPAGGAGGSINTADIATTAKQDAIIAALSSTLGEVNKVFDTAGGVGSGSVSAEFELADRVQIDYGGSGVTEVVIQARLRDDMSWVNIIEPLTVSNTSDLFIIPEMPITRIVFTGGNGTQIASAMNVRGTIE